MMLTIGVPEVWCLRRLDHLLFDGRDVAPLDPFGSACYAGEVTIRRVRPGDEAVADQAYRLFGPKGHMDAESFLRRPEVRLYVAEDEGEILGWLYGYELTHPDGATAMLLYALDVAAKARGKGLALQLVNACVSGARADGCVEAWVLAPQSNAAGIATYGSAGGQRDPEPQAVFKWDFV